MTISGGGEADFPQSASADYTVIGGGIDNTASGAASTVSGGFSGIASAPNSTVGGGQFNRAEGANATVAGGAVNTASGVSSTVPGGANNEADGAYSLAAGRRAKALHDGAFVWSHGDNVDFESTAENQFLIQADGGVGIGTNNPQDTLHVAGVVRTSGGVRLPDGTLLQDLDDIEGTDTLAELNCATDEIAKWSGSEWVCTDGLYWRLGGNFGTDPDSDFLGTNDDQPLEVRVSFQRALRIDPAEDHLDPPNWIAGHASNEVGQDAFGEDVVGAIILGGGSATQPNFVSGNFGIVAGGRLNSTRGNDATISGGFANTANGFRSTISGGGGHVAEHDFATIGGGQSNVTTWEHATIAGGRNNQASWDAAVGGGRENSADGLGATVSGGQDNDASGFHSAIAGGQENIASGQHSSIGGGQENTAIGRNAMVIGGGRNEAEGDYSLAAGRRAKALHDGAFVWADDDRWNDFASTAEDQFLIRAGGGVGINTNDPNDFDLAVDGTAAKPGGGSWSTFSDARLKESIQPASAVAGSLLERLLELNAYFFEYTAEATDTRLGLPGKQIGLLAQEVRDVFPEWVDTDEEGYLYVTERGTTAIMVEALRELRDGHDQQLAELRSENAELRIQLASLKKQAETMNQLADRKTELEDRLASLEALLLEGRQVAKSQEQACRQQQLCIPAR